MNGPLSKSHARPLRPVILLLAIVAAAPSAALARGGMHSHSSAAGMTSSAAPAVPPSLTPDSRLTGYAPLPPAREPSDPNKGFTPAHDPEEAKVDAMLNICHGC